MNAPGRGMRLPPPQGPQRVTLGRGDRTKVDKLLADYLRTVKARHVMLVDKEGVLLTMQGDPGRAEVETVSALVAGAYAVSEQMAQALGKEAYRSILHESEKDNVHLSLVGARTVLAVFYDENATLGMVRLYAKNLSTQLQSLFEEIAFRGPR